MPVLRAFPVRPTKASPSFPAERGERVQLQRGNTFAAHIPLHPSDNLFSFCHMKIFQTYSKIHVNIPTEGFTAPTHACKSLPNQAFLYNRCVSFCWRKQYSPPPMLIVSIFIMSLQEFPMNMRVCCSIHIFGLTICRITANKL